MNTFNPFASKIQQENNIIQSVLEFFSEPILVCSKHNHVIIAANQSAKMIINLGELNFENNEITLDSIFLDISIPLINNSKMSVSRVNTTKTFFIDIKEFYESYFLIKIIDENNLNTKSNEKQFWDDIITITQTISNSRKDVFFIKSFWNACEIFLKADNLCIYTYDENQILQLQQITSSIKTPPPVDLSKTDYVYIQTPLIWHENSMKDELISTSFHKKMKEDYQTIINYMINPYGVVFALYKDKSTDNIYEKMSLISSLIQISQKKTMEPAPSTFINDIILSHMKDSYLIINKHFEIIESNERIRKFLGFKKNELLHANLFEAIIFDKDIQKYFSQANQNKKEVFIKNIRIHLRNGIVLPVEISIVPIFDKNDFLQKFIIFMSDLSISEEFLRQSQKMEEQVQIGKAISTFSHEVKNSINNMLQLTNELKIHDDLIPYQSQLDKMQKETEKLTVMMDSILLASKNREYKFKKMNLISIVRSQVNQFSSKMKENHINYEENYEENCPMILGDAQAIEEVAGNLIRNAIEAMIPTKKGNLTISVYSIKDTEIVMFDVSDTGIGIPKEFIDKLFTRYHTTKHKGTGIGLAVTKSIIRSHKGKITVNSITGATTFHVELPIF